MHSFLSVRSNGSSASWRETARADILLIVPDWPTACWYPQMMRLLVKTNRKIRVDSTSPKSTKTTSSSSEATTPSCAVIREAIEAEGFHGDTCFIVCAAWRESTHKQYGRYLRTWKRFCVERNLHPFHTNASVVIQFITFLFKEGVGYSAINTARSAISAVAKTPDGKSVGTNRQVIRFKKGVFELRTPLPKYQQMWDVGVLLEYFKNWQSNKELVLKDLILKLCALVLLTTAQRIQTIHLIQLTWIEFKKQECVVHIQGKLKHTRPGKIPSALELDRYEDEKLCVVNCLQEYIVRTEAVRKGNDKLLLSYVKPHGPASKDTISRWMKNVLRQAGIEEFEPRSFRGTASTAMAQRGRYLEESRLV